MQVRPRRPSARAAQRNNLPLADSLPNLHLKLRQVHVHAHQSKSVIDDDAAAFIVERPRQHNAPGVDRSHWRTHLRPIVQSAMHAGKLAIEELLIAKRIRLRREMERRNEVPSPLWRLRRARKGLVLHNLVRSDLLQSRFIWLNKLI